MLRVEDLGFDGIFHEGLLEPCMSVGQPYKFCIALSTLDLVHYGAQVYQGHAEF